MQMLELSRPYRAEFLFVLHSTQAFSLGYFVSPLQG
jgi:hypothetical protein